MQFSLIQHLYCPLVTKHESELLLNKDLLVLYLSLIPLILNLPLQDVFNDVFLRNHSYNSRLRVKPEMIIILRSHWDFCDYSELKFIFLERFQYRQERG
jgi:hypothetical protein